VPELKWNKYTKRNRPKENGKYLIATSYSDSDPEIYVYYVAAYAKDLNKVDRYCFENIHHGGFYDCGDEYPYFEVDDVKFWAEIPEPSGKGLRDGTT